MLANFYKLKVGLPRVGSEIFGSRASRPLQELKTEIESVDSSIYNEILIYTDIHDENKSLILELIAFAHSKGFKTGLLTFGVELNDKDLSSLKSSGLDYFVLRVDSSSEVVLSDLIGVENPFKKIKSFVRNALDANFSLSFEVVITFLNYKSLSKLISFLSSSFPLVDSYYLKFVSLDEASENKLSLVMPRFMDTELELFRAFNILDNAKLRVVVEGIPLCYCCDHESSSYELNLILKDFNTCKSGDIDSLLNFNESLFSSAYGVCDACKYCFMRPLCPGIKREYLKVYECKEIYPLFKDVKTFLNQNGKEEK